MLACCLQSPIWPGSTGNQRVLPGIIRSLNSHLLTVVWLVLLEANIWKCVQFRHVLAHGMNKRGLVTISCPEHLREWRGKQGEPPLQTRMQVVTESNQTATLLDALDSVTRGRGWAATCAIWKLERERKYFNFNPCPLQYNPLIKRHGLQSRILVYIV